MSVDRATAYFRSCGAGYILQQIGTPPDKRDPELSSIIFHDMMAAISTDSKHNRTATSELPSRAVALREACGTGKPTLVPRRGIFYFPSGSTGWRTAGSQAVARSNSRGLLSAIGSVATSCEYSNGKVEATEKVATSPA